VLFFFVFGPAFPPTLVRKCIPRSCPVFPSFTCLVPPHPPGHTFSSQHVPPVFSRVGPNRVVLVYLTPFPVHVLFTDVLGLSGPPLPPCLPPTIFRLVCLGFLFDRPQTYIPCVPVFPPPNLFICVPYVFQNWGPYTVSRQQSVFSYVLLDFFLLQNFFSYKRYGLRPSFSSHGRLFHFSPFRLTFSHFSFSPNHCSRTGLGVSSCHIFFQPPPPPHQHPHRLIVRLVFPPKPPNFLVGGG